MPTRPPKSVSLVDIHNARVFVEEDGQKRRYALARVHHLGNIAALYSARDRGDGMVRWDTVDRLFGTTAKAGPLGSVEYTGESELYRTVGGLRGSAAVVTWRIFAGKGRLEPEASVVLDAEAPEE